MYGSILRAGRSLRPGWQSPEAMNLLQMNDLPLIGFLCYAQRIWDR